MLPRLTFCVALLMAAVPDVAAATDDPSAPAPSVTASRGPAPALPGTTRAEDRVGYDPGGRRDPFVGLLSRGESRLPIGGRPVGIKGLLIGQLSVRGVMRTPGKLLAIVQAPDNKTYTVHSGDALYDGTVKVVANDAVIFLQRVDDPRSSVKQREIRKALRTTEENR